MIPVLETEVRVILHSPIMQFVCNELPSLAWLNHQIGQICCLLVTSKLWSNVADAVGAVPRRCWVVFC